MEISQRGGTFTGMKQVSVVILCWNSLPFLKQFLPDLISHTPTDLADLVIVDNGSSDETQSWIRQNHPEIILKTLDRNYGYAGGYRIALDEIETPYSVLLNSDVLVTSGWLTGLTEFMNSHPECGAAAPKIRSFVARNQFEYAGSAGGWIDRFGYPFCRGRIFNSIEEDHGQFDTAAKVFWASGACMMVRMNAYHLAGGLDPHFFAHMEEIDLCWRMHSCGFEVWYTPDSLVFHVGGGSLPNESPGKLYLNFRNNLILLRKNLPGNLQQRIILARMILDGIAAVQFLVKGKPSFFFAVIKGHRHFKRLWKKEYENYTGPVHDFPDQLQGWYNKSVVFAFFLGGKKKFRDL